LKPPEKAAFIICRHPPGIRYLAGVRNTAVSPGAAIFITRMEVREMARLKAQEEKFCQIYTADIKRNGTKAAIEAGYSEKGASVQASRMLRRANIIARVRELEREAAHAAVDDPEKLRLHVYRQLVSLATSDITDVVKVVLPGDQEYSDALDQDAEQNDGQYGLPFGDPLVYVRPTDSLPSEVTAAIKSIRKTKDGVQVEMHSKDPSLRILSEATGIIHGGDLTVNVSIADRIQAARERMKAQ